jgi:hypothetical protein
VEGADGQSSRGRLDLVCREGDGGRPCANGKIAHARSKVERRISLRVGRVEAGGCRKIGKPLKLPFGDQPDLERAKNMAFYFARRLVATAEDAGQSIHDLHE